MEVVRIEDGGWRVEGGVVWLIKEKWRRGKVGWRQEKRHGSNYEITLVQ